PSKGTDGPGLCGWVGASSCQTQRGQSPTARKVASDISCAMIRQNGPTIRDYFVLSGGPVEASMARGRLHVWLLVAVVSFPLFVGCRRPPDDSAPRFAILDKDGDPILTDKQIESYDWATHTMTLLPGAALSVPRKEGRSLSSGIPFSV